MGGGIVSIPYAFACVGFVNGFLIQCCIVVAALFSTHLYLGARSLLKSEYSFSDIAFKTIGSMSSLMLNILVALAIFGILTLYMILFAKIAISVFGVPLEPNATCLPGEACDTMFNQKWFYVMILCLI